jgi:hypothetical protein
MYIIDRLMDRNNPSKKNLICNLWFVNNKYIDGFTDRQSALNFFKLLYSIGKFNISSTRKPYVMLLMFFFVRRYIHW